MGLPGPGATQRAVQADPLSKQRLPATDQVLLQTLDGCQGSEHIEIIDAPVAISMLSFLECALRVIQLFLQLLQIGGLTFLPDQRIFHFGNRSQDGFLIG